MHEQRERRVAGRLGKEQVDNLARAGAIRETELRILVRLHALAIGGRVRGPARENLGVFGHARAVVVLDLIIKRHFIPQTRPLANRRLEDRA